VTITATGGGQTSTETIEIDVRNPNPPVISSVDKILNAGESSSFDYQLDSGYDANWVKFEVSRIPSVDISRRFDFLYDYPHYCSEQLTSRALPLLFITQFKDTDNQEMEVIKKNVREAITQLYGRQLTNGGIVYWPGNSSANDWITSYAGSFLVSAKEKGYDVNEGVINRWRTYQRNLAQNWRAGNRDNRRYAYDQSDLDQAYRLYTLALSGAPEMGAMNRMREIKDLSQQARWSLAAAYALAGRVNVANELVFNASMEVESYSSNNSTYGSSDRDEALILEALVLMGKDREAFRHAQSVSQNLSRERSFTTQSTAWSLVAMGRLAEKTSGSLDFNWTLNGANQPAVKSAKAIFQRELPTKPESGTITINNTGSGLLYVNVVSKTKPLRDSLPAIESNIRLEVSYTLMNGAPLDVSRLKQGTDLVSVVKVTNISGVNNYTDLALTQIIPSGWEIYNERMISPDDADQAADAPYNYRDIRDDRVMTYFDINRGQSKTFRVRMMASYAGSFVFPAIQCEGMYDTNVSARTRAGRVVVDP
ncbi:MAG: alpha-2-macroglobulin, partial [Tannerella sp.]|nr:alpha-2-macroglobulin [Tannerella sp.]